MKRIFVILLIAVIFSACNKDKVNTLNPVQLKLTSESRELIVSGNEFGFDILKKSILQSDNDENVMISPVSISLALAMTYNGAAGQTSEEMRQTMHIAELSNAEINEAYQSLISQLVTVDDKVLLKIANSIWYRNSFEVEPDFINTNEKYYDAQTEALDFNSSQALSTINNWVAENTNDKITEIIDQIDSNAIMFLINAIYFKGVWHYQFNESDTHESPFTKSDGSTINVETMELQADLNYLYNDKFSAVELPYGQGNYSMVIMVPQGNQTADSIINLQTEENWNNYMDEFELMSSVNVFLPKFTFEYEELLNSTLQSLGMPTAFTGGADFTNINQGGGIYISRVKHKTFIEVNEEGTEAAAVTSVQMNFESVGGDTSGPVVRADRPFFFAIRETTSGSIIFSGKIENPL